MEDLVPVVVGGLLTLVGTVAAALGTAIRDVVQRPNKEKKRRADKFEELVAAVYEFDHWLDRLKDRFVLGAECPGNRVTLYQGAIDFGGLLPAIQHIS